MEWNDPANFLPEHKQFVVIWCSLRETWFMAQHKDGIFELQGSPDVGAQTVLAVGREYPADWDWPQTVTGWFVPEAP